MRQWKKLPKQSPYILLGDLNADMRFPRYYRAIDVDATVASFGLVDMLVHFQQRKKFLHGSTPQIQRRERITTSIFDYILSTDRRNFSNVTIREQRHYTTDHYMILVF
jgi:endonuclease/exonuclease/phosphatase family metal-dependent hydrolase